MSGRLGFSEHLSGETCVATDGLISSINILTMLAKIFNTLWLYKLNFIRNNPMLACWLAWLEGILIGVLIMYFWF